MSKLRVNTLETLDGSYAVNVADLSLATTVVEDNLTSTNVASALSANQGRVLKGLVDGKQDTLVSGTSLKTVNSTSLLGSGNVAVGDVTGVSSSTAQQLAVASGTTGKGIKFVPVQIDDSGNVTVVGTGLRFQADFSNATHANRFAFQTSTANGTTGIFALPNGTATTASFVASNASDPTNSGYVQISATATEARILSGVIGASAYLPIAVHTGGSPSLNFATDGTFTSVRGAIGYGTGAGGTVTQATSKSTAVTLNKPSGQITMNNAALAAGASVEFSLNNGYITASDIVLACISGFPNYTVQTQRVASGGAVLRVTNVSGGSLSEAITVNFAVLKGATA